MNIEPMLLEEVEGKEILEKPWIFQIKENGVRAIIHVKDHKIVGIRNRSNNPILYCFPELKNIVFDCDTAILDAEIVVFKNGKTIFYKGIDQRRSSPDAKKLRECPATIVLFDIIQFEQEVLINKPYKDRLALLDKFKYSKGMSQAAYESLVQVVRTSNDGVALWEKVVRENHEGLVAKDPNAIYELGKRSKQYIKVKNYKYVDVIVERTEPNPKGTKIFANVLIDDIPIQVECQQAGAFNIGVGDTIRVKYLDIVNDRLIQPTRF